MTPTDVVNLGLLMAGKDPITDIDDTDTTSSRCRLIYHPLRDAVLRDHLWNFAIARKELAQNAPAPVSGFAFGYKRDDLDLRVLGVNDNPYAVWQVEGRDIVTDETAVVAKYVQRVGNPDLWDALFVSMFSTFLGSRFALMFSHDAAFSLKLLEQYMLLKNDAQAADGQEGSAWIYGSTALTDDIRND
jgi:hypothetical protein